MTKPPLVVWSKNYLPNHVIVRGPCRVQGVRLCEALNVPPFAFLDTPTLEQRGNVSTLRVHVKSATIRTAYRSWVQTAKPHNPCRKCLLALRAFARVSGARAR